MSFGEFRKFVDGLLGELGADEVKKFRNSKDWAPYSNIMTDRNPGPAEKRNFIAIFSRLLSKIQAQTIRGFASSYPIFARQRAPGLIRISIRNLVRGGLKNPTHLPDEDLDVKKAMILIGDPLKNPTYESIWTTG